MTKPHLEFVTLDMGSGWETPPGYPRGIQQKILASDLDETNKTGSRTRLLRLEAGAFSTQPFVHDYYEEVFVISGDLIVKGQPYPPNTYACRPPQIPHGPIKSNTGCLMLEFHYFLG
jgi:hypothetical protein